MRARSGRRLPRAREAERPIGLENARLDFFEGMDPLLTQKSAKFGLAHMFAREMRADELALVNDQGGIAFEESFEQSTAIGEERNDGAGENQGARQYETRRQ